MFKPGSSCVSTIPGFHPKKGRPKNTIKQGKKGGRSGV